MTSFRDQRRAALHRLDDAALLASTVAAIRNARSKRGELVDFVSFCVEIDHWHVCKERSEAQGGDGTELWDRACLAVRAEEAVEIEEQKRLIASLPHPKEQS